MMMRILLHSILAVIAAILDVPFLEGSFHVDEAGIDRKDFDGMRFAKSLTVFRSSSVGDVVRAAKAADGVRTPNLASVCMMLGTVGMQLL